MGQDTLGYDYDLRAFEKNERLHASIDRALRSKSPSDVAKSIEIAIDVTQRGLEGDAVAALEYETLLWELHTRDEPETELARRWIAGNLYPVIERHIPQVEIQDYSPEQFMDQFEQMVAKGGRSAHPMVKHMIEGDPNREQIRIWMEHNLKRTRALYQDATDLAVRLCRDVEDASIMYNYLYGEIGEADPNGAHPILIQNTARYLDVDASFTSPPKLRSEMAYLNNRTRSFRTTQPAWGLAIFYVTDVFVTKAHAKLHDVLVKAGIPEEHNQYYKVHISLVPPRRRREWKWLQKFLARDGFQQAFLTSLDHHFKLQNAYFDRVWESMQSRS